MSKGICYLVWIWGEVLSSPDIPLFWPVGACPLEVPTTLGQGQRPGSRLWALVSLQGGEDSVSQALLCAAILPEDFSAGSSIFKPA